MHSLILHGIRLVELQKWRPLSVSVNLFQNASVFSNSFSSGSAVASPQDGRKGKIFTVSYPVDSLGLAKKLAPESISRKVSSEKKGNADAVRNLLRSHGFTDSQISNIIKDYPQLLVADAAKSIGTKLKFLQSTGASSSELTEIVSKVPKILGMKEAKAIRIYYDFVKEIIEADKSSKYVNLCLSLQAEGSPQENKIRNVLVLRELGVPQRLLFSLLFSNNHVCCGKEKFEESLKKVVEMGFDPTTSKFVEALQVYGFSSKTMEEKVNIVYKSLGLAVDDVWKNFKMYPRFLAISEKNLLNSIETFLGLGLSRDEVTMIVKRFPTCLGLSAEMVKKKTEFLVKEMNWPIQAVASNPVVIGCSLKKRILPRCNVIKALMFKGLLGDKSELPAISSVLKTSDQTFLNRYVMKHDDKELVAELMTIFTKDRVS